MGQTENSIAGALKQAHVALLADLRKLEQAVSPFPGKDVTELHSQLVATLAHITEHFRFEEQNGYMDTAKTREPRLDRTIRQLAEEHGDLRHSLEAIIRQASDASSLGDPLRDEIQEWIRRVRQHERRENDLVQDAFNLDIGPED